MGRKKGLLERKIGEQKKQNRLVPKHSAGNLTFVV